MTYPPPPVDGFVGLRDAHSGGRRRDAGELHASSESLASRISQAVGEYEIDIEVDYDAGLEVDGDHRASVAEPAIEAQALADPAGERGRRPDPVRRARGARPVDARPLQVHRPTLRALRAARGRADPGAGVGVLRRDGRDDRRHARVGRRRRVRRHDVGSRLRPQGQERQRERRPQGVGLALGRAARGPVTKPIAASRSAAR